MNGRMAGCLLAVLLSSWAGISGAQSKDKAHPAALGPGVNKGNIVNFDGPQYWYFYAGPGKFSVRVAFHEMGLIGNPYRQGLTVQITDEAGKDVSHGSVISQGNTASVSTNGDYQVKKKIFVKLTAQQGLIRMGGYYELEMTGASSFDGKAGATAGVKAQESDPLIYPSNGPLVTTGNGPLVKSGGPLVKSSGPLVKSGEQPLVTPSSAPLVKAGGQLVYPGKPLIVEETTHTLRILLAADVLFDFGHAEIRPDAEVTLRQAATKLKFAKAKGKILVEGYTDSKGTTALNQRLSKQRAGSVVAWLEKNDGYTSGQFDANGYGAARPVAPNANKDGSDDPAGRQQNRRVEIVVAK